MKDGMTVEIGTGFGHGPRAVAYASYVVPGEPTVTERWHVPVTVRPALRGRDVGYAALAAVAGAVRDRGVRRATFHIDDQALADDLREHRTVPSALGVPYVKLRCLLNRFDHVEIVASATHALHDLSARARADAALDVAA